MARHAISKAIPGDFIAIGLSKQQFGYVRIFRGNGAGVLPIISSGLLVMSDINTSVVKWYVDYMGAPDDPTVVIKMGSQPFANDDEGWLPPRYYAPGAVQSYYSISDRWGVRKVEEHEVKGLQQKRRCKPATLRKFILEHEAECEIRVGAAAAPQPEEDDPQMDTGPILLEVEVGTANFPIEGRDQIEDPLHEALIKAGVGMVSGGGGGRGRVHLDIDLTDLERGLEITIQVLRELGCPRDSTFIRQVRPRRATYRI